MKIHLVDAAKVRVNLHLEYEMAVPVAIRSAATVGGVARIRPVEPGRSKKGVRCDLTTEG